MEERSLLSDLLDEPEASLEDESPKDDTRACAKRTREQEYICTDFNLAPSRQCKFGERCRERMQCSYIHSTDRGLERAFCYCDEPLCVKPHPNRAKNKTDTKRRRLICKNCNGDHMVTDCPYVKCYKCLRYGHLANNCR